MLKKLTVHGFKSFCDRTDIVLGSGITAIVGPNGCGKSNLADALRWVLGEQNPRTLRCARLHDLIFSGTETRKAMGMAEVKLLFDSVEDGGELEIARRFARDGTGEFRLNGKACRWKDVVERLAGTGLSHTGYVVIGQGTIHELVSGRPEDRRAWIEEASGVAKVRLDKRDMEAKLEAAKGDILRLNDLLVELAARKERLAAEMEVARSYRELVAKKRDLDLSVWLLEFDESNKKVASLAKRLDRVRTEIREAEARLPDLEAQRDSLRAHREAVARLLESLAAEREEAARDLLDLEKRRDAARGRISVLRRETETRTARKAAILKDLGNLEEEQRALSARRERLESAYQAVSAELSQAEEKRAARESVRKDYAERTIRLRAEAVDLAGELASIQRDEEETQRQLEETRKARAAAQEHSARAKAERDKRAGEIAELEERRSKALLSADEARRALAETEGRLQSTRKALDREVTSEKNVGARMSGLVARRKLLEDLERSFEGYGKGPRAVLEARSRGMLKGIVGPVGELLSCDAPYIAALSAAVGAAAEDIVTADEDAAKAAIEYLKSSKNGRATFLPLSLLRPRDMHPRAVSALSRVPGVRPLLSVVSYPDGLEAVARYLVGRVVLADSIDAGLAFMKESGWSTRVVTMGGESIDIGGAMSGGEAPRSEALFRRKRELLEVAEAEKALSKELEGVLTRRKSLEGELASLEEQAARARSNAGAWESEAARLAEAVGRAHEALRALDQEQRQRESAIASLSDREAALARRIAELSARDRQVAGTLAEKEEELRRFEAEVSSSVKEDQALDESVRALVTRREELARDLSGTVRRLDGVAAEISVHRKNLEEEEKEILRQSEVLSLTAREEQALSGRIAETEEKVRVLAGKVSQAQKERDAIEARLSQVLSEREKLERERDVALNREEEAALELEAAKRAARDTADFIEQEFGVSGAQSCDHPRIPRSEALRETEEIEGRLKSLGNVNLKAAEDYEEVKGRVDLITEEKADVEVAIEEINRARAMVEKEIEMKFTETFHRVAENFSRIFQELFGGGRGDLVLVEDTLGVEVVAEPPGRRQKHLNLLSGGERSLCGIALIFAILSVRPSPFIVLDEADTALDESNIARFAQFLKRYSQNIQFLVITHQKATMEAADLMYGVTMEEPGVSKVFGMKFEKVS